MKVSEIAQLLAAEVQGDATREIRGVAALDSAGPEDLTFAEGERALVRAANSRAGCILVAAGVTLAGQTTLAVSHPKLAFIHAAQLLRPAAPALAGIHPTAVIAADARLAPDVSVGPYVVVERQVTVGAGTSLGAGVFLGRGAQVGAECTLYPRVTLYPGAKIGNRVILHAGVVIGGDGFGYVFAEGRHHKFPQFGQVILEDDVEIGCNTTVDRGSLGTTIIGEGTKIDNLVQVAHNVKIGRHSVIAAQTGISGSVEIGEYVVLGGQVGVADHVRIEDYVVAGAQAGIPTGKVIRKGTTVWGTPARPLAEFKKMYAHMSNLPRLARKVKDLSRQVSESDS
ncbi:MAG: UDP-3-O-(3-hydroxymyristoyl)glucosamine N-acyltransferase [Acidobacteria bacterium]|nr:UDP-3-O-(3-hydroxymyristoyl)glucosamine N-acyltransferase [Acidobacteriota bacterium]